MSERLYSFTPIGFRRGDIISVHSKPTWWNPWSGQRVVLRINDDKTCSIRPYNLFDWIRGLFK